MYRLLVALLLPVLSLQAAELPSKKYLSFAAVKTMVAASEAKAREMNVQVTICIVDESLNLIFWKRKTELR